MSANDEPNRVPDSIDELLSRWARVEPPAGTPGAKSGYPIVRITRPTPGRRYVVDANMAAAGSDGSQAGSSLVSPKHAPIVSADITWTAIISGKGGPSEIHVEFVPAPDARSGRATGGTFQAGGKEPPLVHAGMIQTPFNLQNSPVGDGSALTFALREPRPGVVVEELLIFLGGYVY